MCEATGGSVCEVIGGRECEVTGGRELNRAEIGIIAVKERASEMTVREGRNIRANSRFSFFGSRERAELL